VRHSAFVASVPLGCASADTLSYSLSIHIDASVVLRSRYLREIVLDLRSSVLRCSLCPTACIQLEGSSVLRERRHQNNVLK
jgi:hypothetical protein